MLRRFSTFWTKVFQIIDISIVVAIWFLTKTLLVQSFQFNLAGELSSIVILIVCWLFVTKLFSLYESKRLVSLTSGIKLLTLIASLYYLLINVFIFFLLLHHPSPLLFIAGVFLGIGLFHLFIRTALQYLRSRGFNQRKVIIYGAGSAGRYVASNLMYRPQTGMNVVGFLDDELSKQKKSVQCQDVRIPILGSSKDIRHIISEMYIHEVIIALPSSAHQRLKQFILETSDLPVSVRVVPDLFDVISVRAVIENVFDIPVIGIRQPHDIGGIEAVLKRTIDLVFSTMALLVAIPFMVIIALFIRVDSNGPILFRQKRVGLNGKPFKIYKFRTMVEHADKQLDALIKVDSLRHPAFKITNDPRVTRVGRILRKTSLDELPQLYNVLRGEMSLVGPRPEEAQIVGLYSYEQRQRLAMKPGITGPMQVNGRGELAFEERLNLELEYIKNYSLYRDLIILAQTVPAVLLGKGAH